MKAGNLARSAHLAPDAFVGRKQELKSLAKVLGQAESPPRPVVIEGEAGIGKTRLAAELLEQARQASTRVLLGTCYQIPEAGPYYPFRQILKQLHQASIPEEFFRTLADRVPGQKELGQLSEDVRGRRAQFLDALSDSIIKKIAAEESLLLVEDIQWADIGSLLILNNLLDLRPASLKIVCTIRLDEPLDADVRQLITRIEQRSHRMVLRGLPLEDVRQLVENIVGLGRITEEELNALHAFTRGNPMLLHELLLHLRESGLLELHTVREIIAHVPAPNGLSHFIGLRLRRVPEQALRVLSVCSVVGSDFNAEIVSQISDEPLPNTEDCLQIAVDKGILQVAAALVTRHYRFAHPLFAKIIYDSLSPSDRRALHRRIATIGESGPSLPIDDLARHHALGFRREASKRAIDYCQTAAEEAEYILAYEKAAHFWGLALTCTRLRSRRRRAELYRRQGWALWAASKWNQASDSWGESVHLYAELGLRDREAEVALALGDMHRWRIELTEAEYWLRHALRVGLTIPHERGQALAQLGGIRRFRGESDGTRLLEEAEGLIQGEGDDPIAAYWLSYGFRIGGEHSKAYAVAKSGLKEAQRRGHSSAAALLAASLVNYELSRLDAKAARSYVRIGKQVAHGDAPTALINAKVGEALFLGYSGKWDQVEKACEQWMAQVRLASKFQVATALMIWAEAKLAQGQYSVAEAAMSDALPALGEMDSLPALQLARVWVCSGRSEDASDLARRHLPSVAASPRWTGSAGRAVLGDIAASLDDPALWRTCYELLKPEPFPVVVAYSATSVQRVLGRLASRRKLWVEAIAHFDLAVEQLSQGEAYWELAQTYLAYADMREVRGRRGDLNKAAALELEATAVLEELGMQRPTSQRVRLPLENGNRYGLTARELEILTHVAGGRRNIEIAKELSVSPGTVNRHVENIFAKMDVRNRTEAVMRGVEQGLFMRNDDKADRL